MSKPNPKKIAVSGAQSALNNAFADLALDGLPAAPESPGLAVNENAKSTKPAKLGRVVLRRETAHRGGKAVVVIDQFESQIRDDQIDALARKLRAACGCGGTIKNREIEIQGDQPAKLRALLEAEGFRVAGAR